MRERIPGTKNKTKTKDTSVKENFFSQRIQAQNFQEIWDTMKIQSLQTIEIDEREGTQLKGIENVLNKISIT